MRKDLLSPLRRVVRFYVDGFRQMTLGRTLWAVILIKLFIIFAILKVFFFPNFLHQKTTKGHEADYVFQQIAAPDSTSEK